MVLLIVLGLGISLASAAGAQPGATPAEAEVSQAQIQNLIRLLEDQQACTEFLQRLKDLTQLQAQTTAADSGADLEVLSRAIGGIERAMQ